MMSTREAVYNVIDGERTHQDKLNSVPKSVGEELTLLRVYLRKAEEAYATTFGDLHEGPTIDVVREIAGICVRCMERHGAIIRKEIK